MPQGRNQHILQQISSQRDITASFWTRFAVIYVDYVPIITNVGNNDLELDRDQNPLQEHFKALVNTTLSTRRAAVIYIDPVDISLQR